MKKEKGQMFDRKIKAPDGIHDGDVRTNRVHHCKTTKSDIFWCAVLVALFITSCTMSVIWG